MRTRIHNDGSDGPKVRTTIGAKVSQRTDVPADRDEGEHLYNTAILPVQHHVFVL
jgi:hypothetical protein